MDNSIIEKKEEIYFDGTGLDYIGLVLVNTLIICITLCIGAPWVICRTCKWKVEHTVINGRRLKFNGTGGAVFGKLLLWTFLTIITLGIYYFWVDVSMTKWVAEHTTFQDN